MAERFPGYDVLRKRNSPSWNAQTRAVIEARLAIAADQPIFLTAAEWDTLRAICNRIVPQPADRADPVPIAAMVERKLQEGAKEGYRDARLPPLRAAWRQALQAIDAEAGAHHGQRFHRLTPQQQDALLKDVQMGEVRHDAWQGLPPALFFSKRLLHDIAGTYYTHPTAWNEIGFGGPASPRGYVRLDFDRRDPWEAAEARPGHEAEARDLNERIR